MPSDGAVPSQGDRRVVVGRKGLLAVIVAGAFSALVIAISGVPASAAPSISVSPTVNLGDAQTVTVTVTGFTDGPGGITQCSTAAGQPTIQVAGKDVPVSCSDPLKSLQTVAGGGFTGKPFVVHAGTIGPPAQGTDSAGKPAADDAALYPCPPTPQQAQAGAQCVIAFGTAAENAQVFIAFKQNPISPAIGVTTTVPPSPGPTNPTTPAAVTATTAPAAVLGTTFESSSPAATDTGQPPAGEVARTGPSDYLAPLSIAGFLAVDIGYLFYSSTRAPRRKRGHKGVVPRA